MRTESTCPECWLYLSPWKLYPMISKESAQILLRVQSNNQKELSNIMEIRTTTTISIYLYERIQNWKLKFRNGYMLISNNWFQYFSPLWSMPNSAIHQFPQGIESSSENMTFKTKFRPYFAIVCREFRSLIWNVISLFSFSSNQQINAQQLLNLSMTEQHMSSSLFSHKSSQLHTHNSLLHASDFSCLFNDPLFTNKFSSSISHRCTNRYLSYLLEAGIVLLSTIGPHLSCQICQKNFLS